MWLKTSDLISLPGLPGSIKGLLKKSERENWRSRDRQARGGGKEFHLSSLPIETQRFLATKSNVIDEDNKQNFAELAEQEEVIPVESLPVYEAGEDELVSELRMLKNPILTAPVGGTGRGNGDRARAALEIQLAFGKFCDECCTPANIKKVDCEYRFCEFYTRREITFPKDIDVYKFFPTVSRSKLCRDRQLLKEQGTQALAGNYGNRKGHTAIDQCPEMQSVILGHILKSAVQIHQEIVKRYRDDAPSLPSITRWVSKWKEKHLQEWTLLRSKNLFNSRFRAAYGDADAGILAVNQRWEIDATKGDIFLADGKRYSLLRVIDVFSRRIKTYVSPTVSAAAYTRGLLYQAFLDWGIPDEIRTDNGKAEISGLMSMALADLEIKHHICTVRSPWEKPFVERSLNTRNLLSQLPGFCGANVSEQQQIREREENIELRLTVEQLQAEIDRWTISYENRRHRGFDGNERQGMTPIEAWTSSPGSIRRISSDRERQALSLLLSEVPHGGGVRIVQKKGIEIGRGKWYADAAGEWVMWIGHSVLVKYDPCGDAGIVHAFELGESGGLGRFLFTATNAELMGENRAEKAQKAKDKQKVVRSSVNELKKLAKVVAAEEVPDIELAEVIPFPLSNKDFENVALTAAATAIESLIPNEPKPMSGEELAAVQVEREKLVRLEARAMQTENPGDRYRRLWFLQQGGDQLSDDDVKFMIRFESMTQGRIMKQVLESQGVNNG